MYKYQYVTVLKFLARVMALTRVRAAYLLEITPTTLSESRYTIVVLFVTSAVRSKISSKFVLAGCV